ncbi:MAG TPA: DNA replication and repair protein RecF, partial [Candidatus Eisenbacteria bacterium]|nr:DNA replication and repair protein RecF [Candidatus Eisenbacteria bacterium]
AKSRASLAGLLPTVLFRPEELEIIIDGPSLRREFLNEVLEQVDKEYVRAKNTYERSLRQRNALLRIAQETGRRNTEQFEYWDSLLIESGQLLTAKREAFLDFINTSRHDIFVIQTVYDKSTISKDRLEQYRDAEVGAGVTLVGPHRDDFVVNMKVGKEQRDIRSFGSRGQQRLAVLQLKLLQIEYIKEHLQQSPLLILDDIFSELDSGHIQLVLEKVQGSQIVLTTTHREFIPATFLKSASLIELISHSGAKR